VVCATNRDLGRLVREGKFRGDLLARLNEFHLSLPPLRDRKEDIFQLSRTLLARHQSGHMKISYPFMIALIHYDWPYNVRELEACLKRAAALSDSDTLDAKHLPETIREVMAKYGSRQTDEPAPDRSHSSAPPPGDHAPPAQRRGQPPSEEELRALLAQHHGNVAAVGRQLGKERMQIHRWMQRYAIVVDEYRS
jgi:transcriptional regulator with GAF, ATPase, and Fis domain